MKPILFNTDMARAILNGRKTVTRRVVKPQPIGRLVPELPGGCWPGYFAEEGAPRVVRPPYFPGDILYVRETWALHSCNDWLPTSIPCQKTETGRDCYIYRADGMSGETSCGVYPSPHKWRPSILMPREAARIFLRVTDVRVERLQDIDWRGALAEGILREASNPPADEIQKNLWKLDFYRLWDSVLKLSDRTLYGWAANPWVWVIEFERVDREEAINGPG